MCRSLNQSAVKHNMADYLIRLVVSSVVPFFRHDLFLAAAEQPLTGPFFCFFGRRHSRRLLDGYARILFFC